MAGLQGRQIPTMRKVKSLIAEVERQGTEEESLPLLGMLLIGK